MGGKFERVDNVLLGVDRVLDAVGVGSVRRRRHAGAERIEEEIDRVGRPDARRRAFRADLVADGTAEVADSLGGGPRREYVVDV